MLYASETWGDISCISEDLLKTELQILKRILNIKSGTCSDLVYYELKRPPIILKIRDRQFKFFEKIKCLSPENATIQNYIFICNNSRFLNYYESLHGNECKNFLENQDRHIDNDVRSMVVYYRNIVDKRKSCIYTTFTNDYYRKIITRWRLSNHSLNIETQRYTRPRILRENRVCLFCYVLEDENHVLFHCPLYRMIRIKHTKLLSRNQSLSKIMNPEHRYITHTANFLYDIEKERESLKL